MTDRLHTWQPYLRLYVVAAAFALTLAYWAPISRLLLIVVLAAFATVALDATIRTLQRAGLSRRLAATVTIGSGLAVVVAGVLFALPTMIRQLDQLVRATPGIARAVARTDAWEWVSGQAGASDALVRGAQSLVEHAPGALASVAVAAFGTAFNLAMAAVAVLFLLASGDRPVTLLVRLVPSLATSRGWDVLAQAYESIGRYVVGALAQATIAGATVAAMLAIVDVPYALALGVITFFWDFVPMIGSTIAAIPCVAVALASNGVGTAVFVAVFIIAFTQVENMVLQPRIQGGAAKVPGAAIFFSVMVGGTLFGIVGAILAVPSASVVATILNHWFEHRGVADLHPPRLFDEHGRVVRGERVTNAPQ